MDIRIFTDEHGFEDLKAEWNPLLARSRSNTLFLTWEWQTTWWRCLGGGDLWLLAWYDQGEIAGIAPLSMTVEQDGTRRLSIVGCVDVSDYLDVIVAAGSEDQVYAALLDWLQGPDAPAWDVAQFCNIPQQSLTHQVLPELAAQRGLEGITRVEDVCPIIELPDDFETYLQERLSKKQRHEVRRKLRRIQDEAQVNWYVVTSLHDIESRWTPSSSSPSEHRREHSFMTPEMQAFFREITRTMHEAGWLYLAFIEVNGAKAAAMLAFSTMDRLLIYNSGYDPVNYAELSPGIVLTSYIIEDAIKRGIKVFDFLQGNEVYKYRLGATDTVVYDTQIRPSREVRTTMDENSSTGRGLLSQARPPELVQEFSS